MTDVFISYSRKDRDFVRELSETLVKREKDAWVDWEDIPLAAKWRAEIYSGIESAHAFLFVISPDSVTSEVCNEELEHAVKHNKRLVPVLRREVAPNVLPEPLESHNWISCRDGDDFEDAFKRLVQALDTDLEWAKSHTRLLTRAVEWEGKNEDNSLLLRGTDLKEAEEWQVGAAQKDPKPTPVQDRYILTSRKAATRRQRVTLAAIASALVVAIALGIVAVLARNEAVAQRAEAEHQANVAVARQLAAQARLAMEQQAYNLERSALLAAESMRRFPSLEAEQALRGALALLPRPLARMDHGEGVQNLAVSPDGKLLATSSDDNVVRVWDLRSERQLASMEHGDRVFDVAFSPDGEQVATASADQEAHVWRATDGEELAGLDHDGPVYEVDFGPDGGRLATASADKKARVWEVQSGKQVVRVSHGAAVWAVDLDSTGQRLATGSEDGTAQVWDVADGGGVSKVGHDGPVQDVTFDPEGKHVATASEDGTTRVWEASGGDEIFQVEHENAVRNVDFGAAGDWETFMNEAVNAALAQDEAAEGADSQPDPTGSSLLEEADRATHDSTPRNVIFSPNGGRVATVDGYDTVHIYEVASGEEVTRVVHDGRADSNTVEAVAFSSNGERLATASADDTARVWDADSGQEVARMTHSTNVYDAVFAPDGERLVTASGDGTARVWEATNGESVEFEARRDAIGTIDISPDGRLLAVGSEENSAIVLNVQDGRVVSRVNHDMPIGDVAFSQDGDRLATAGGDATARLWEVNTGRQLASAAHDDVVRAVALGPGGERLTTATWENTLRVWDTEQETTNNTFQDRAQIFAAFSPDGRYAATQPENGGTVLVRDVVEDREVSRLSPAQDGSASVVFGPDGDLIATSGVDMKSNAAQLWETRTGRKVAKVSFGNEVLQSANALSPDGKHLIASGFDRTLRIWNIERNREVARILLDEPAVDAEFSPDGRYVAAAVRDGTARTWIWRPQDMIEETCARLTGNMKPEEWRQYVPDEGYRKTCPGLSVPNE